MARTKRVVMMATRISIVMMMSVMLVTVVAKTKTTVTDQLGNDNMV